MFEKLKYLNNPEYFKNIHTTFIKIKEKVIKSTKDKKIKKYFKASFQSVMEMLHYLFLHDISIFKSSVKKIDSKKTVKMVYSLLIINISAQIVSDELPNLSNEEFEEILFVLKENFNDKKENVEKIIKEITNLFGKKDLYKTTYAYFIKQLDKEENLEESITFGILLNEMINDCILKTKKLI